MAVIDKFLWSVVVLTVLPVKQYAEDKFKIQEKALKFSCELLLAGCIK